KWGRGIGIGAMSAVTPIQTMLTAGWNDVVVDYNEVAGLQQLLVTLDGPDQATGPVPHAQLRPVEPTDRLTFASDDTHHTVTDANAAGPGTPGVATMTVHAFSSPTQEIVTGIELTYQLNSPHWDHLLVELLRPGADPITIRDHVALANNGLQLQG